MPVTRVGFTGGTFEIGASLLPQALEVEPRQVQLLIRTGAMTSLCERGIEENAGRFRLTFFHGGRRLLLVVDETGRLIRRSLIDFGDQSLPAALRQPGG